MSILDIIDKDKLKEILTEENFEAIGGMKQVYMNGTDGRGYNDFKPHFHIPLYC
jgi:hypothetical protein